MRRDIPPANDFNHSDAEGDDESDYEGQGYSIEEAIGNGSTAASTSTKKARGHRSQAVRGPTALPTYRGTGFEGEFSFARFDKLLSNGNQSTLRTLP